jgi:DNA-binding MarR family transcriptional regulator
MIKITTNKYNASIKAVLDEHKKENQDFESFFDLHYTLSNTIKNYENYFNKIYAEIQLAHHSIPILFTLLEANGCASQDSLVKDRKLSRTKQAIGLTLNLLEKRGLVTRSIYRSNRRKKQVQITDKGLALLRVSMMIGRDYAFKFTKFMGENKIKTLIKNIKKVNTFYENELNKL